MQITDIVSGRVYANNSHLFLADVSFLVCHANRAMFVINSPGVLAISLFLCEVDIPYAQPVSK